MALFDMWIQVSGFQIPVLDSVFKGYPITCAMAQSWGAGDNEKGKGKNIVSLSCLLPTRLILHSHLAVSHAVSSCMKMTGVKSANNFYPCK